VLVWLTEEGGDWQFQHAQVNDQGMTVSSQKLALGSRYPTHVSLLCDSLGGLHLFWMDTETGARSGVYHAGISADGQVISEARRVTGADSDATAYSVAEASGEALEVFWSDARSRPEQLYHAVLNFAGEQGVSAHALGIRGEVPALAVDNAGAIHLVWQQTELLGSLKILYATFDARAQALGNETVLASFPTGTGARFYPPEIGLDTHFVYVFWSQEQRSGLTPGTAVTYYESFPIGDVSSRRGAALGLPASALLTYEPAVGAFNYQSLCYARWVEQEVDVQTNAVGGMTISAVPKTLTPSSGEPSQSLAAADFTYFPYPIPGQRDELGVVLSSRMEMPRQSGNVQIAFVVMRDGFLRGLEVAGRTRSESVRSVATVDDQGSVHLAWIEAGIVRQQDVCYASTSPTVRAALSRRTFRDTLSALASGAWSATAALSFLPVVLLWVLLPFTWLVVFSLLKPDTDLRTRAGRIGLAVAVALYLPSKLFLVPSFLSYAPFLNDVAGGLRDLVYLGFPLAIMAIALIIAAWYARRSEKKLVAVAFVAFAATDALLSLMLYMPNFLTS
jgi:hypothetical protein